MYSISSRDSCQSGQVRIMICTLIAIVQLMEKYLLMGNFSGLVAYSEVYT